MVSIYKTVYHFIKIFTCSQILNFLITRIFLVLQPNLILEIRVPTYYYLYVMSCWLSLENAHVIRNTRHEY